MAMFSLLVNHAITLYSMLDDACEQINESMYQLFDLWDFI